MCLSALQIQKSRPCLTAYFRGFAGEDSWRHSFRNLWCSVASIKAPTVVITCTVAGARQGAIAGVPAIALSLDWKRGKSTDNDFKLAAAVSLPLIKASLRDIQEGVYYPTGFFLNVDIPLNPSEHKGFKVTRQGTSRLPLKWKRQTQEKRMQRLKDTGIGLQMAQLGHTHTFLVNIDFLSRVNIELFILMETDASTLIFFW